MENSVFKEMISPCFTKLGRLFRNEIWHKRLVGPHGESTGCHALGWQSLHSCIRS